ncbi:Fic family protein [Arthrobacter sp. NIO-1057]|uniref:Fic family protein n=1 Tax=Arthrobacter sp. NIO-1057 TaxID=993071 RepID=UPI00071D699B|nr:Fic family protein [Arthrobacter sp. NIO-1057]KSU65976.1 cell filamentation protein Fic [Arthrobacter sp. NIO-1057]SCC28966.1 Fic family protein [Arthrobacter sp. NIO-1057]
MGDPSGDYFAFAVPPLSDQTLVWKPVNPHIFSNAEVRRQTGSYASPLPARIADWAPEPGALKIPGLEEASQSIQDFDVYSLLKLGSHSPEFGPMSDALLRIESSSSSQIEQLTTTARQLAPAEINVGDKSDARTVVGNVHAMESALALAQDMSVSAILAMHQSLMNQQSGMEDEAGKLRNELVWIGGTDTAGPRGAVYIAPEHTRVHEALEDLVQFMSRTDLPAIVQVAIAHAQFETIHPFVDGNGRTGRALVHSVLRNRKITQHTTAPISAGILRDTEAYFEAMKAFREGDASPIIHTFINASIFAANSGKELIDTLSGQLDTSKIKLAGLRSSSAAWKILTCLISQPVINARYLKNHLNLGDAATHRALGQLTERGVLVEKSGQSRNRIWQHDGVLKVLDEYAKALRRPSGTA